MRLKDIDSLISIAKTIKTIGIINHVIDLNDMDNIMFRNLIMQIENDELMTVDITFRYILLRDSLGFLGTEIDSLTGVT